MDVKKGLNPGESFKDIVINVRKIEIGTIRRKMVYKEKTQRENQINAIKYTIAQIELHGDSVLNEIDKSKGKDWALSELKKQLEYLENLK